MKKLTLFLCLIVFSYSFSYSQRLIDNGALSDPKFRFSLKGSKWNKKTLTYCFLNHSSKLSKEVSYSAVRGAFNVWAKHSTLTFREVNSPNDADIKIAWYKGDHGDGNPFDGDHGVLAHAYYPPPAGGRYAGHLHFDDDENWTVNPTGFSGETDLASIAAHEIGHLLGIQHSNVAGATMAAYYSSGSSNIRELHFDDVKAVWELYGIPNIKTSSNVICTGNTVTFEKPIPRGATVSWSAGSGVSLISGQGTSNATYKANATYSGYATVTATMKMGTQSYNIVSSDVWVGTPKITVTLAGNKSEYVSGSSIPAEARVTGSADYSNFRWSVSGDATLSSTTGPSVIVHINGGKNGGHFTVTCRVDGTCNSAQGSIGASIKPTGSTGGGGGRGDGGGIENPSFPIERSLRTELFTIEVYTFPNGYLKHREEKITRFDLNNLEIPIGIYLVKKIDSKGNITTEKIAKQ